MKGYKTYLVALVLGVVSALRYLNYLDKDTADALTTLLLGGGLAALRVGMLKVQA